ncbi:hypothetical protein JTB14_004769 [Gonioctena quinquepunctata]|nr:hypothetical protein JTB14_004769 [Gonioctena quinquepunctata]
MCSAGVEGKGTRLPFKKSERRTKNIGDLIHSDVCGPFNPVAFDGSRYFQTIIDDYSHFVVKTLKTKDEANQNLIDFVQEIERQKEVKVKAMRLDNGGEYISNSFISYCRKNCIISEYTIPYTPQENGTAERMNRTLLNKIRTKFIDSGAPKELWCEALKCSVYELNRLTTKSLPKGQTPAKKFHGKGDLYYYYKIKIFGSRAWYTVLAKQNKLDNRAEKGVLVGYCGGGYRLWLPEKRKVIRSRDVRVDESIMEYKILYNHKNLQKTTENQPEQVICEFPEEDKESAHENEGEMRTSDSSSSSSDKNGESLTYNEQESTVTRSGRTVKIPQNLQDYEIYTAYCLLTKVDQDPKTYKEASIMLDWQQAIDKELNSHEKLETWQPAKLPVGH